MTVVFDAWALVAHLKGEPSASRVEEMIDGGDGVVSEINLGEVVYSVSRSHGVSAAEDSVRELRSTIRAEAPDWALTLDAARIKAWHPLSYADGFAIATARRHAAPLYTGDPEIIALADLVEVVDLR